MSFIDLAGQKFGRLTVLSRVENSSHRKAQWLCQCDCGNTLHVPTGALRSGNTRSCGCLKIETTVIRSTKHGHSRPGKKTSTYKSWIDMIQRCTNTKNERYGDYGGRGIAICERWHDFRNFLADMGEKPSGLTIERRNNNGNYEPDNCYWATYSQQVRNRRNSIILTYKGQTRHLIEWADHLGISYGILHSRWKRGWSVEEVLSRSLHQTKEGKSHFHLLTFRDETLSLSDWAKRTGIPFDRLKRRIHRGWNVEDALTRPPGKQKLI